MVVVYIILLSCLPILYQNLIKSLILWGFYRAAGAEVLHEAGFQRLAPNTPQELRLF